MGMVWTGRALDGELARRIRTDSEMIYELMEGDEIALLQGGPGGTDASVVDLDKSWHGLHWLLTGSADTTDSPLSDAVLGGAEVGEDDGYGPPRLLDPARVAAVSAALSGIDADALRAVFDPPAMSRADVYPDIWSEPGIFDDYLAPSLDSLKALYADAAARGDWVLHQLT